jgi:anaerobic selenocysteine-containing dehydrogenase
LTVRVEDRVATEINPNFAAAKVHPAGGKVCVKAYGLVQKAYTPDRVLYPMKRTNPNKGRGEDPGFVRISWDEALDLVAGRLNAARTAGLTDETGFPRLAASFGGGGTPTAYMGTLPALLAAWGPVDMSFGSGQGVKCYHSEHLYGELWHRAFTVSPDTPLCEYLVSFGANVEASGGVCGVKRHADARKRGMKRVQIEPHLSITGACSAEWIPIKPKTDAAFLHAMIHVLLHLHPRERLDLAFLEHRTSSPYLIGPNGSFLRDPATRKPLVAEAATGRTMPFDAPGIHPALEGTFTADGIEVGPDGETTSHTAVEVRPAFAHLVAHVRDCTPDWAGRICDVPAERIRQVADEFLAHARVGESIEIEGVTLPYRPVSIALGKTVNNGWGGYECCWARTLLACLVGALEVPGGTLGTTVRLNRPADSRWSSVKPGPDGFMEYPMNPTSKSDWASQPARIGGTKYVEQFWDYQGFALRDTAVPPQGEGRDFTWIATELARRCGLLEAYNLAINRGAAGVKLSGSNYDFSLDAGTPHDVETIWDAACRAATAELTDGAEDHGLAWFREHGFRVKPFSRLQWYLYPRLIETGLRFEQPYQERLFRIGQELGRRLHEQDIHWWDKQLAEYQPMPHWRDLGALWEDALAKHYQVRIADYPFWLITARSMQYSWGSNVGIQLIKEVAGNVAGHGSVLMNETAAQPLGIADGDLVEVRSPLNSTRGRVVLCQGIRPDTLLIIGQFDQWATPYAKDTQTPNMNALVPMLLDLTDATGSSADLVKVAVTRIGGRP